MGLSTKAVRRAGFTLIEVMTVMVISSILLVLLAGVYQAGLWQVSKSSGRIEVVRAGRTALNNIQRYVAASSPALATFDDLGQPLPDLKAVFSPDTHEIHDPANGQSEPWQTRIQFFSPIDLLEDSPPLSARELQTNPVDYAYEIGPIPGTDNLGQDLVLRRLQIPLPWDNTLLPLGTYDTTVIPRLIGRRLGIPDSSVPGGFRDALQVRRLRGGALMVRVNVSVETISDDTNRNRAVNVTNSEDGVNKMNTVTMTSIFQPPYFNFRK